MVRIRYNELRIETVSGSSGVFSGSNQQRGFKHAGKRNEAFGSVSGTKVRLSGIRTRLEDRDDTDMPTGRKQSEK
jgi:hypothetical protein